MTTETEALRRAFEGYVNPDADIDLHWQAAGYYAGRSIQMSWLDFQAGHAAAKAETAAAVAKERERAAQFCDRRQAELLALVPGARRSNVVRTHEACAIRAGAKGAKG